MIKFLGFVIYVGCCIAFPILLAIPLAILAYGMMNSD